MFVYEKKIYFVLLFLMEFILNTFLNLWNSILNLSTNIFVRHRGNIGKNSI